MDTLSERLRFLLSAKGGATSGAGNGARPFATLERRTGISADKWRNFMRGKQRATDEMVEAAGKTWPWYVFWLVTGSNDYVEQDDPSGTAKSESRADDIVLKRAKTPDGKNAVNVPHDLKLRDEPYGPDKLALTSHTFEWGYFGAGPCELAANVLFAFGLAADDAIRLREKFANDVIAKLDRAGARLEAQRVRDWIAVNHGHQED